MRWSTTSTSKRALEEPPPGLARAPRPSTTSCPSSPKSRPSDLQEPLLVVHEQDRAAGVRSPRRARRVGQVGLGDGEGPRSGEVDGDLGAVAGIGYRAEMVPPRAATMLSAMARPRPVPVRRVVK